MDSGYCYELQFMSRSLEMGNQLSHQQCVIRQAYVLKRQVDWPVNMMLTCTPPQLTDPAEVECKAGITIGQLTSVFGIGHEQCVQHSLSALEHLARLNGFGTCSLRSK